MKIEDVTREKRIKLKNVRINLNTTKEISKWLTEKNISPQAVFDLAIEELKKEK